MRIGAWILWIFMRTLNMLLGSKEQHVRNLLVQLVVSFNMLVHMHTLLVIVQNVNVAEIILVGFVLRLMDLSVCLMLNLVMMWIFSVCPSHVLVTSLESLVTLFVQLNKILIHSVLLLVEFLMRKRASKQCLSLV